MILHERQSFVPGSELIWSTRFRRSGGCSEGVMFTVDGSVQNNYLHLLVISKFRLEGNFYLTNAFVPTSLNPVEVQAERYVYTLLTSYSCLKSNL
jgi:hypothetical protein